MKYAYAFKSKFFCYSKHEHLLTGKQRYEIGPRKREKNAGYSRYIFRTCIKCFFVILKNKYHLIILCWVRSGYNVTTGKKKLMSEIYIMALGLDLNKPQGKLTWLHQSICRLNKDKLTRAGFEHVNNFIKRIQTGIYGTSITIGNCVRPRIFYGTMEPV